MSSKKRRSTEKLETVAGNSVPKTGWLTDSSMSRISLALSLVAILVSLVPYYGPRIDAAERISGERAKMVLFAAGRPLKCDDKELCETWVGLVETAAEEATKALEAERSNLSGAEYAAAYADIYGVLSEAIEVKIKLGNPTLEIPEFPTDARTIEKAYELRRKRQAMDK